MPVRSNAVERPNQEPVNEGRIVACEVGPAWRHQRGRDDLARDTRRRQLLLHGVARRTGFVEDPHGLGASRSSFRTNRRTAPSSLAICQVTGIVAAPIPHRHEEVNKTRGATRFWPIAPSSVNNARATQPKAEPANCVRAAAQHEVLESALVWYTPIMEVTLSPKLQAKLTRIASERGTDAQALAREAIERMVEYDDWFIREVDKGLAQIERGETLTHEEVGAQLEQRLTNARPRS